MSSRRRTPRYQQTHREGQQQELDHRVAWGVEALVADRHSSRQVEESGERCEGEVEIHGRWLNRYRVWHPLDHVSARYVRRLPDGSIGPGARIHLVEILGRNPKYKVDVVTTIEKLDEEGFIHNPKSHGPRLARMEYAWREVAGGTLYKNSLVVPRDHGYWIFRKVVVPLLFPEPKGRAWVKHNVEEVGMFENFLPDLYRLHKPPFETRTHNDPDAATPTIERIPPRGIVAGS